MLHTNTISSNAPLSEHERQATLAALHLDAMVRGGQKKSKVPNVILELPCGCSRERGWEGQDENSWTLLQNEQGIVHAECARVLRQSQVR